MINKKSFVIAALFAAVLSVWAKGQSASPPPPDSAAKMVSAPAFKLPDAAATAGITGKVVVGLTVEKSGSVKNVTILGGPTWPCGKNPQKEIGEVIDAIKQNVEASQFSPAVQDGKAYSSDVMITFTVGRAYRESEERKKIEDNIKNGTPRLIQGGILNGKALNLPKPAYPLEARANRASGVVNVELLIDEQGKVVEAGTIFGHPLLQSSARESACAAKFAPTLLSGHPVKVSGTLTYKFVP
jgi:TonB family protein